MWNLKQGWKNIFAVNCLSLCSEVSPFAEEAGLRARNPPSSCSARWACLLSVAPLQPALRTVFLCFYFFWLRWMNCLPEITNLLLQHLAEFG